MHPCRGPHSHSHLPIPHEPPEIADRLLAEGAVIRRAARGTLDAERQIALGQYFTPMWVARLDGCDVRNAVADP